MANDVYMGRVRVTAPCPPVVARRWESVNSVFRTAGFVWTSGRLRLARLVGGTHRALELSLALYMAQSLWLLFARSAWQFYAVPPRRAGGARCH